MTKGFLKDIIEPGWNGNLNKRQKVALATNDAQKSHMNLRVYRNMGAKDPYEGSTEVCLQPATAIKVRDALIEAYPLPVPVAKPAPEKVFTPRGGRKQILIEQPVNPPGGPSAYPKTIRLDRNTRSIDITAKHPVNDQHFGGTFELSVAAKLRDALTEMLGDAKPVKPVTIADFKVAFPAMFVDCLPPAPPAYPAPTPVAPKASPKGAQQYKGNGKHDWEHTVDETFRLRVPGGWLYKTSGPTRGGERESTTVFVPVPAAVGYAV